MPAINGQTRPSSSPCYSHAAVSIYNWNTVYDMCLAKKEVVRDVSEWRAKDRRNMLLLIAQEEINKQCIICKAFDCCLCAPMFVRHSLLRATFCHRDIDLCVDDLHFASPQNEDATLQSCWLLCSPHCHLILYTNWLLSDSIVDCALIEYSLHLQVVD